MQMFDQKKDAVLDAEHQVYIEKHECYTINEK